MIRRLAACAALVLAAAAGLPSSSPAYEIYPKHPVHEAMTRLSYQCLEAAGGARPQTCEPWLDRIESESRRQLFRRFNAEEKASSWPDDPQREIGPFTAVRFGVSVLATCARKASDTLRPAFTLAQGGLSCSSHWGSLQFLHAMRSAQDEDPKLTRQRMLDWAEFTYSTATGRVDTGTDYCGYFREHPSSISGDLAPDGFAGCSDQPSGRRTQPAWRVATLFTLRCGNPFSGRFCREKTGAPGDEETRQAALGALLHLVQDSYSQSHAVRGPQDPPLFRAEIVCTPPTAFHLYSRATDEGHGSADKPPAVSASCRGSRESDDVVTAGATVLWMARTGAEPADFLRYLEERVLGRVSADRPFTDG